MKEKRCFKCGVTKELTEFYAHKQMKDGHLNKCKECAKRDVKENYEGNREHYTKYERQRCQRKERKEAVLVYQRRKRERSPEKDRARQQVRRAIKAGKLIRLPCEICGSTHQIEAHHNDYSRPLNVRWLCFKHHREIEHGQVVMHSQ